MTQADFVLTYDGPALREHEMNVRDLAPAMLAVGEAFEALNSLYNGKAAKIAVNVRAHQPGCFKVVFDVVQVMKDSTEYLAGTQVTSAINLLTVLFGGTGAGAVGGLLWLTRKLKGRKPEKIERLTPGMFRLSIDDQTYDVPVELLDAYKEVRVRRAVEGFVMRPLQRPGIDEMIVESHGFQIARVVEEEAPLFKAPTPDDDVVVDDERRAAFTIGSLDFDEDGMWKLFDGQSPIKAKIEDKRFLSMIDTDEIRFAKHDVLVCMVHFVQRRTMKGLTNEYTVVEVLEHIPAPRQLRFPDADLPEQPRPR
ncbi:hypothetical protein [Sphingomonas sp. ACRSK]|uniref:hypothetical protein n=1 Tax=Sphingomonas sp. ACRSK TaxID=2918213 RepID=UPI001EF443C6|nr:hypothetical protein [Sphingomonas sp. ACRSK]MCG7349918.1 hypothetical protein [Sphingomonas sp. ACRSK]